MWNNTLKMKKSIKFSINLKRKTKIIYYTPECRGHPTLNTQVFNKSVIPNHSDTMFDHAN